MSVRILQGDCREVLKALPGASVQMCVTSPPYYALRDYGVDGQIGLESSVDTYVTELVAVFREVRRILRPDGTLWLNLGDSYASSGAPGAVGATSTFRDERRAKGASPKKQDAAANGRAPTPVGFKPKDLIGVPWRVAFALQADGWYLRSDIIWAKPNPMPESVRDRPTKSHEYIFLLTKQARYFFDAEAVKEEAEYGRCSGFRGGGAYVNQNAGQNNGVKPGHNSTIKVGKGGTRNIRSVWTMATAPFAEAHFATFPPELAERCIKAGTSERGACPACGAPWVRVMERTGHVNGREPAHAANNTPTKTDSTGWAPLTRATGDWQPSCACNAGEPVPCVALDPFAGAGTTGLVADRLGRDAVLIELSGEYVQMMRRRIEGDAPLFASVGVIA